MQKETKAGKNKKVGRPKIFDTPEALWELFLQYEQYAKNNPVIKNEVIKGGDMAGSIVPVEYESPLTWEEFEYWLSEKEICHDLDRYKRNENSSYGEFRNIIARIDKKIFSHNYKGAATGLYNANLIARKLGIKEQTDSNVTFQGVKLIMEK